MRIALLVFQRLLRVLFINHYCYFIVRIIIVIIIIVRSDHNHRERISQLTKSVN